MEGVVALFIWSRTGKREREGEKEEVTKEM
jgi:hypothetical protein